MWLENVYAISALTSGGVLHITDRSGFFKNGLDGNALSVSNTTFIYPPKYEKPKIYQLVVHEIPALGPIFQLNEKCDFVCWRFFCPFHLYNLSNQEGNSSVNR